ncbi:class I SAM-dependent methyltransferase [Brevibacillus daliensis]|uniref:class I SAM-dependent methyltransferase n=1 Tax=Brevibacillus daliensis TaxID=2892995 RepID=UPI001E3500AE|nr:SAM-dependent methyltransferase [Brevibacillus daliensis]
MSSDLLKHIGRNIIFQESHMISFATFMENCLYHHEWGYYRKRLDKVGKNGDFFTSSHVHQIFGEVLADSFLLSFTEIASKKPVLLELGGGTGRLMQQVLTRIRECEPSIYQNLEVIMVEISPFHIECQKESLESFDIPIRWYSSVQEAALQEEFEGIIFSNEYFDAFPVHLLEKQAAKWHEIGVTCLEENDEPVFQEKTMPVSLITNQLNDRLPTHLPDGMRIEWQDGIEEVIEALGTMLKRGRIITIDYGDEEGELYHESRKNGTLVCYYQHQMNEEPFMRVGEQDITAHVNFTRIREWGEKIGLHTVEYQRQDQFLIQNGILEKAQAHQDRDPFTSKAMKQNRAISQLLLPGGLGGLFRVLIQEKK